MGWTPLLAIGLLAAVGLWPDPNPNPIGPGLLLFFTFWPAVICLGVGIVQVRRACARAPAAADGGSGISSWGDLVRLPASRVLIGLLGLLLLAWGLKHLFNPTEGRSPGGALLLAVVAFYWAVRGKIPDWARRDHK